jgi:outer membrane protein assembly factor BamD (BamD/ComL family)
VNITILIPALALAAGLAACSGDQGKQQLETARFEEQQNNKEHAIKLYEEVVRSYPGSANAKTAQERLNILKGGK